MYYKLNCKLSKYKVEPRAKPWRSINQVIKDSGDTEVHSDLKLIWHLMCNFHDFRRLLSFYFILLPCISLIITYVILKFTLINSLKNQKIIFFKNKNKFVTKQYLSHLISSLLEGRTSSKWNKRVGSTRNSLLSVSL